MEMASILGFLKFNCPFIIIVIWSAYLPAFTNFYKWRRACQYVDFNDAFPFARYDLHYDKF